MAQETSYDAVRSIFRSFFHSLVTAIEPEYLDISTKLYADEWISRPFEAVAGEAPKHAALRIVREVETQLK